MEIGYRNREGKSRVGGDGEIGYRYGGVDGGLCVCVCGLCLDEGAEDFGAGRHDPARLGQEPAGGVGHGG